VTWPTVLADRLTAPCVRLFSFRTLFWVVGEKVIGLGFGLVLVANVLAPEVIAFDKYPDVVTMKREAVAAFCTKVESL